MSKENQKPEQIQEPKSTVFQVLREAFARIGAAPDMGDTAGKVGLGLFLGGLWFVGAAPFCVGLGFVLILVSVLKGIK